MSTNTNRRQFLKFGGTAAGAAMLLSPFSKALAETCGITPVQTAGPFYPGANQFGTDNDLTVIPGGRVRAVGQVVYIKGRVVDQNCRPLEGANVEIWQACHTGKYNNHKDPNPAALDPNFKYWAETFTDKKGDYVFKTIVPGAYPADTDWVRPPHIHYKISRLGYKDLITQMYFKGNEYNDRDLVLQNIPEGERDSVIVDFLPATAEYEVGSLVGTFDITLRSVR